MSEAQLPPSEEPEDKDKDADAEEVPTAPTRRGLIEDEEFELSPDSLVGSWFFRVENGQPVWRGAVVGEIQPGVYLIEVEGLVGSKRSRTQVMFDYQRMIAKDEGYEFRFFDDQEAMLSGYAEYVIDDSGVISHE